MPKSRNIKTIKIQDLELSHLNPRFTFLNNMDMDMVNFIKNGNINYSEKTTATILLKNEGDLQDMVNLMSSISNSGWIDLGEQLIVIKSNSKYIVAEGNRRLLALKLLFKMIRLDDLGETIDEQNNQDMHWDEELMKRPSARANYQKMKEMIKNYDEARDPELRDKQLRVMIVTKSVDLWTLLYTKHISGERPGMRQWKRGKYFVDILNFFPDGINKTDKSLEKKISIMLRRDITAIFRDYIQAQFVRDMYESINHNLDKTKENIRNAYVSSLETPYSLKHIKNILKKELNYSDNQFKEMFDIEYDDKNGILSYSGNLDREKLFKLIIKYYELGVLKTRPIADDAYDDIAKEVVQLFSGSYIDYTNGIDDDMLSQEDVFSFTINQIDNFLSTPTKLSDENKLKLKSAKEILENDFKINEKFKEGQKKLSDKTENIFTYLNLQLKHNAKGIKKFTHAQAFTLRTIMEQFFLWGIYFSDKHLEAIYPKCNNINDRKSKYICCLSDETKLIIEIMKASKAKIDINHVKEMLDGICKYVNDDLSNFFLAFYNYNKNERRNSHVLNGFIHAYHRIIGTKKENIMLSDIKEMQKYILFILENLKWDNINTLDKEIKKYITNKEKVNNAIN